MTDPFRFNPHSVEGQFSLQMAGYLAHSYRPRTVHLYTHDPEVAIAAVLQLARLGDGLSVENEEIQNAVSASLGLHLKAGFHSEPDLALALFPRGRYPQPPQARHLVVADRNAISYKSLLYPGRIQENVIAQLRWFRKSYTLEKRMGMFGPRFLLEWGASLAAGRRFAPTYYRFGQRAMDHLFTTGAAWWTGYIIIFSGTCLN